MIDWVTANLPTIVSIIAIFFGGGGLVAFLNAKAVNKKTIADAKKTEAEAKKTDAEAKNIDSQTATNDIKNLRDIIDEMRENMKAMQLQIDALKTEVKRLDETLRNEQNCLMIANNRIKELIDRFRYLVGILFKALDGEEIDLQDENLELPDWWQEYDE